MPIKIQNKTNMANKLSITMTLDVLGQDVFPMILIKSLMTTMLYIIDRGTISKKSQEEAVSALYTCLKNQRPRKRQLSKFPEIRISKLKTFCKENYIITRFSLREELHASQKYMVRVISAKIQSYNLSTQTFQSKIIWKTLKFPGK